MTHHGYPSKEEAIDRLAEAYHALGFALEEYAKVTCGLGAPGLASQVASAMGLAREAHNAGLSVKEHGRPKFTHVVPYVKG